MKSALASKPIFSAPELQVRSDIGGSEKDVTLHRIIQAVKSWFTPGSVQEDAPRTLDAQEIEAMERRIRKFTEEHRFTGFPC
jgi:hypothetical protein